MKKRKFYGTRMLAVITAAAMSMTSVPHLAFAAEIPVMEEVDISGADVETQRAIWMDTSKTTEERVQALLSVMTLEEKAAQMVQPEQGNGGNGSKGNRPATPEDVKNLGIGSVLSGGGSAPASGNGAEDWENRVNEFKAAALESRLGIPLIYGVDAVHGHNNVDNAVIFPHNIGLGAANDTELVEKVGAAAAEEIRATGIQWTFAPTLGIPDSERWGRFYECFGEDPAIVSNMGAAYIRGFQKNGVAGTAKHYIGEGQTQNGVNQGNVVTSDYAVDSFDELMEQKQLLAPYQAAVEAGAYTVMASYNSVDGLKCHANKHLLTEVLKGDTEDGGLGFKGFVVSDYNGVDQITADNYNAKVAASIDAGVDMFMEPYDWENCIDAIVAGVTDETISQERIDDAVSRILWVKFEMGLFEEEVAGTKEQTLLEKFGGAEHRAVAREAAAKTLTVLKNDEVTVEGTTKPVLDLLDDDSIDNILVAGYKGNDVGAQCGGWTITWQGGLDADNGSGGKKVTEGTTIYEGFQEVAGDNVKVSYNARGKISAGTDVAVVVVGEDPYAESNGDKKAEELTLSSTDLNVIKTAAASKGEVPTVLVLMTGRPVAIADYIDNFDAVVEAWLPGTEGAAVADVMLDESRDFTATCPVTWTWYPEYLTEKSDASKVLFPRGTGLKKDGTSIKADGQTEIPTERPEAPNKEEEQDIIKYKDGIDIDAYGNKLEGEYCNPSSGTASSYNVATGSEMVDGERVGYVEWSKQDWGNAKWPVYFRQAGTYTVTLRMKVTEPASGDFTSFKFGISETGDPNPDKTITGTGATDGYQDFVIENVEIAEAGKQIIKIMDSSNQVSAKLDYIQFTLREANGEKDEGKEEAAEDPADETAKESNGSLISQDAVKVWMTSTEKSQSMDWYKYPTDMANQLSEKAALDITSVDDQELTEIYVNPEKTYQEFLGMGTSLEEATINNLIQLTPEVQDEFLRKLVDPEQGGMTLFRITIGTSDFTAKNFYTYYDAKELTEKNAIRNADGTFSPDWQNSTGNGFSIQKDIDYKIIDTVKKVIELAKEYGVEDEVKFFASSWTPPGWMKEETSSSKSYADNDLLLKGGSLNDAYIDDLAMYYTRYLEEYAKQGIDIYAMTLQNEPMLEINYPSCAMSGEQEGKLAVAIKKAINSSSVLTDEQKKCKLWAFDHNPSGAYSYTEAILSVEGANDALDGIAFHDYGGSLTEMQRVLDNLLNKDGRTDQTVNLTERSVWGTAGANSIITYLRNSGISYNSWVTMLDSNVGVHQWVGTPDPTMFARAAGSDNDYWAMPEFYLTGQFSRFIRPGYVRVDSNLGSTDTVTNVVFKDPETGKLAAVVVNATDKKQNFKIVTNGTQFIGAIPAKNVATYVWNEPENIQNDIETGFSAVNYAEASEGVKTAKDADGAEYVTTSLDEDYIDYIVNVKEAGTYGIIFEQQPTEAGQKISVYQGDTLLREIAATKTKDTAKVNVRGVVKVENAGVQQIRVKASAGVKLYNISMTKTPQVHALPGKIPADEYESIMADNDEEIAGATVNELHQLENLDSQSTVNYKVNVPAEDTYVLRVSFAAEDSDTKGYIVKVDGTEVKSVTGQSTELELTEGEHTIGINVAGSENIAWIAIGSYLNVTTPEITEENEDKKEIVIDVEGGTIADEESFYEVTGLPEGVTAAVEKVSDAQVKITLNGNRTKDFDEDKTVDVKLQVKQENSDSVYATAASFVITAEDDAEEVTVPEQDLSVPENVGDTKEITLKMKGGTFNEDGIASITVGGDAASFYEVESVTFVDSTTVKVVLTYTKKFYRPVQLAFNIPAAAYDDGSVALTVNADMEPVDGLPEAIELSDAAITLTEDKAYANSGSLANNVAKDNYVDYFLDVKEAGTYAVTYSLHTLTSDGTSYQNALDINRGVPDTIGTNSYKQLSIPALWTKDNIKMRGTVDFEAGKQTLEFKAKSAGWVISSIEIAPVTATEIATDEAGTTIAAIDFYDAENSHAIMGENIEYNVAGTAFSYMVNITKSGTYQLNVSYGIESSGSVKITADRIMEKGTVSLGTVAIPATGGWSTYKSSEDMNIDLPEGIYTFRISLAGDGANLKNFTLKLVEEKNVAVIPVESVTLASEGSTVEVGTRVVLTAKVGPEEADDKTVTWSTSNPDVATVEDGVILAKSVGTAVITATSNSNQAIKAEYTLVVTEKKQEGGENNNTDNGGDNNNGGTNNENTNQDGNGSPAADTKAPDKVTNFQSVGTSTTGLKLTWNAVDGATGYNLTVYSGSKKVKTAATAKTTYSFKKLKKLTKYTVGIQAIKVVNGQTLTSDEVKITTATSPAKASIKKVEKKSARKIKITWKKVSGADGYQIYMKAGKGKYKCVKTIKKGKTTSYTYTKAKKGTKYTFKIRAYKKAGNNKAYGAFSKTKSKKM